MAKPEAEDDRDKRIEDLKRRAEELCEGKMELTSLDDCPAEMEESFWRHVVDYEEAPWTTHFHQLETAGVSLAPPDLLNDQELTAKLWEVIQKLALLRVFIEQCSAAAARKITNSTSSITLMTPRASIGTRISPMIPSRAPRTALGP